MNGSHDRPAYSAEQTTLVQLIVRDREVNEAEEGIKCRTQKREEVAH